MTISLKNIKDGWLNHLMINLLKRRKPSFALQAHIDKRLGICLSCPHLRTRHVPKSTMHWQSCKKCGCAFPAMIFAYEKRCPDGRWDVLPADVISASESE